MYDLFIKTVFPYLKFKKAISKTADKQAQQALYFD